MNIDFPPLYTLQINTDNQRRQLDLWKSFILEKAARDQIFFITKDFELFTNKKINRTLQFTAELFRYLVQERAAIKVSDEKLLILYKSLDSFSDDLLAWIQENHLINAVETFRAVEDALNWPDELIRLVLTQLERFGKSKIIGEKGFKILS
jgi:ESCRT-II complex subunit